MERVDTGSSNIPYEKSHADFIEKGTKDYVQIAMSSLRNRMSGIFYHGYGEYNSDVDENIMKRRVRKSLSLCERRIMLLNDVVPVVSVFSWLWEEKVPQEWEEERGAESN